MTESMQRLTKGELSFSNIPWLNFREIRLPITRGIGMRFQGSYFRVNQLAAVL